MNPVGEFAWPRPRGAEGASVPETLRHQGPRGDATLESRWRTARRLTDGVSRRPVIGRTVNLSGSETEGGTGRSRTGSFTDASVCLGDAMSDNAGTDALARTPLFIEPSRPRRHVGALRRLCHAGALSGRHHGGAHAHAHRRRPLRRLAHGPAAAYRRRCRPGAGAPRAGRYRWPRALGHALHPAHQRGRRHPRRPARHPQRRRVDSRGKRVLQGLRHRPSRTPARCRR